MYIHYTDTEINKKKLTVSSRGNFPNRSLILQIQLTIFIKSSQGRKVRAIGVEDKKTRQDKSSWIIKENKKSRKVTYAKTVLLVLQVDVV